MADRRTPNDVGDSDDAGEPKPSAGRRLQDEVGPRTPTPQSKGFDDSWKAGTRKVTVSGFEPDEFEAFPRFLRSRDPSTVPEARRPRRSRFLVALLRLAPAAFVSATVALIAIWIYSENRASNRSQVADLRPSTTPMVRSTDQHAVDIAGAATESPAAAVAPAAPLPRANAGGTVRGVTDREIRFGTAAPFSGSAKELGHEMKIG